MFVLLKSSSQRVCVPCAVSVDLHLFPSDYDQISLLQYMLIVLGDWRRRSPHCLEHILSVLKATKILQRRQLNMKNSNCSYRTEDMFMYVSKVQITSHHSTEIFDMSISQSSFLTASTLGVFPTKVATPAAFTIDNEAKGPSFATPLFCSCCIIVSSSVQSSSSFRFSVFR